MVKCPKCEREVDILVSGTNLCTKCYMEMKRKEEEEKSKVEEKVKQEETPKPSKREKLRTAREKIEEKGDTAWGKRIKWIVFFGIISASLILISKPLLTSIEQTLTPIIEEWVPGWGLLKYIGYIGALVIAGITAYFFNKMSVGGGIASCIGLILILTLGSTFLGWLGTIIAPGGKLGDIFIAFKCMLSENPELCIASFSQPEAPEGEKKGNYDALTIKLGSKYRDYQKPILYGGLTYTLPVEITNLNPDIDVEGVVVSGELENETNHEWVLLADECTETTPCTVTKRPKTLSLTTDKELNCIDRELDLTVDVKYSYHTYGSGEFVVVRSERDLDIVKFSEPTKGPGPLDIIVYFAPEHYIVGNEKTIRMFISVENKRYGKARLGNIIISPLIDFSDFSGLKPGVCTIGTEDTISFGVEYTLGGRLLYKEQTYRCDFTINRNTLDNPYKTIPFEVKLDYTYIDDISESDLPVNIKRPANGGFCE